MFAQLNHSNYKFSFTKKKAVFHLQIAKHNMKILLYYEFILH